MNIIVMVIGSVLVLGLSISGMIKNSKVLCNIMSVIGIGLAAWSIVGLVSGDITVSLGIWGIILGLFIGFSALLCTQIVRVPFISAVDRSGDTLATMSNIKCKGDEIVVKAVLLGSMPSVIIIKPEELWKMLGLIESNVLSNVIRLLFIGWKRSRSKAKDTPS